MEYLPSGIRLEVPEGCFPLTTDSMALADFSAIRGDKSVLDLGSGCGTLGLLLPGMNAAASAVWSWMKKPMPPRWRTSAATGSMPVWKVYARICGGFPNFLRREALTVASPIRPIFPGASRHS